MKRYKKIPYAQKTEPFLSLTKTPMKQETQKMKLKFLGTGGGRFTTTQQTRKTGGIVLKTRKTQIHIDPGPGALVHSQELLEKPKNTEAVIISHGHLDHCNDTEPIIEMMTELYQNPGKILGNKTVLKGSKNIEKSVSDYHQKMCQDVEILENSQHQFRDLKIQSQTMKHSDPNTQGFKITDGEQQIGFWTDTEYQKELTKFYKNCDTLVINCPYPKNKKINRHTSLKDIPQIVENTNIKTVIITHFGSDFLSTDMEEQEEWLSNKISQKVVFAEDNMVFPGNLNLNNF